MLFAIVFGYLIFTEIPTRQTLAGAGLIVVAGLFILWRERKLGLQRAASLLRTENFPATAGQHCRDCDFVPLCPVKSRGSVIGP